MAYKFGRVKLLTNLMSYDDDAAYDDDIVETNLNWSVIRRGGGCLGGVLPRVGRRGVRCKMAQSLMRLRIMFLFFIKYKYKANMGNGYTVCDLDSNKWKVKLTKYKFK